MPTTFLSVYDLDILEALFLLEALAKETAYLFLSTQTIKTSYLLLVAQLDY